MSDRTLGQLAHYACGALPEGWEVQVSFMLDSGNVTLLDPDGEEVEFATNYESIEETFQDAIDHAIKEGGTP